MRLFWEQNYFQGVGEFVNLIGISQLKEQTDFRLKNKIVLIFWLKNAATEIKYLVYVLKLRR